MGPVSLVVLAAKCVLEESAYAKAATLPSAMRTAILGRTIHVATRRALNLAPVVALVAVACRSSRRADGRNVDRPAIRAAIVALAQEKGLQRSASAAPAIARRHWGRAAGGPFAARNPRLTGWTKARPANTMEELMNLAKCLSLTVP